MAKVYSTPGVYIEEKSAFPNSVVAVATAVPAFIGHTEKAVFNKKNVTHEPVRISSFGEYLLYFGGAPKTTYSVSKSTGGAGFTLTVSEGNYSLYNSIKLFYSLSKTGHLSDSEFYTSQQTGSTLLLCGNNKKWFPHLSILII